MNPLSVTASGDREIVMTRTFEASRHQIFEALTNPKLLQRWLLGPKGWSMPVCEVNLKEGGSYRYVWRHENGEEMGMGGAFREIVRPERIIHTERFDHAWYPGEAAITTTLTEKAGLTTMTVTIRYGTQGARDLVLHSPMKDGVAMSYDRLAALLSEQRSPKSK